MIFSIYSYTKFGDHCVAFGIVHEFAKRHADILYYSDYLDDNTYDTYVRLFSSLRNVHLMREPIDKHKIVINHSIANTKAWYDTVGDWDGDTRKYTPPWFNERMIFDRQWYFNADMPLSYKWDNFYFKRDPNKEKEVYYDKLGLKDNEEFIFLHEDPERNLLINKHYINTNIKLIEFCKLKHINILDILYTIEKAKEVHIFNTGLLTFIDLMNIQHNNLNYHKYVRFSALDQPALRLNWKIIE